MSIDDMVARDTRIDRLAKLCGWSRRETRACLEDIWALCYDRIVPYLPAEDIEVTALRDAIAPPAHGAGFGDALFLVGLARPATSADRHYTRKDGRKVAWKDEQWRDRLYIAGAADRVGYLLGQSEAGRQGGKNSGQSRRRLAKRALPDPSRLWQGPTNPPDPVPDPVPDSGSGDLTHARARAISPELDHNHPARPEPPERARTHPPDPGRGKLARDALNYAALKQQELKAEGIDPSAPNIAVMPPTEDYGWKAILARADELAGDPELAATKLRLRIDTAAAEARASRSLKYFVLALMFEPKSFSIGTSMSPEQITKARRPAIGVERGLIRVKDPRPGGSGETMPPLGDVATRGGDP